MIRHLALCLFATTASADVTVTFQETDPADLFTLTNASCALRDVAVVIDLSGAASDIFFDTSMTGAGDGTSAAVHVVAGDVALPEIIDGDRALSLRINTFDPATQVVIAVDLDDRVDATPLERTLVYGRELAGTRVFFTIGDQRTQGRFTKDNRAVIATGAACLG